MGFEEGELSDRIAIGHQHQNQHLNIALREMSATITVPVLIHSFRVRVGNSGLRLPC
jgi:hypothetical protein